MIEEVCRKGGRPYQLDVSGRDTGTDAMAASLAGVDSAATSIGFPIRNMHTISETGHTRDILAAVHGIIALLRQMDSMNKGKGITHQDFENGHPNLNVADKI